MKPLSILIKGVLLLTVVGPSLAMGLFGASSMAAGSLAVSLLYACIFIALGFSSRQYAGLVGFLIIVFFGSGIIYLNGVYSFYENSEFDLVRFWQSNLLSIIYFFGAYCLVILSHKLSADQCEGAIKFVFWVLILSAIAGLVRFSPFFPEEAFKSVLFYGEPSHFALDFLPFFLYVVVRSPLPIRMLVLVGTLPLCLLLENLTLLVGFVLIIFTTVRLRLLLLLLGPLTTLALLLVNSEYYVERLDFSGSSTNLSTLVYIQGLERAYLNLLETNGLGVGFQQFGIVGSTGDIQEDIKALIGSEANMLDGGSVAQKFIGEFGILGILFMLLYFGYFVRNAKWLLKESAGIGVSADPRDIFFRSCFVMYSIDLLIRGVGYFSSSGFLFVASLCWLFFVPRNSARQSVPMLSLQKVS